MSNPNNAVGTNAAYSGRTSVNAFNDDLAAYTSGVLSGWACVPSSGLTLALGGVSGTRDVAVAEDPAGNKTSINNISGSPISVTISAPPASNSRIDAIVAYVDNPPEGTSTTADNPGACGLITVEGTAASTPVAPNESAIRTAITADGASGSTAYYVVLASLTISSGTTDITTDAINPGDQAILAKTGVVTKNAIDYKTMVGYASSLPYATKTNQIAFLGGKTVQGVLTRYGDLVFLRVNAIIGATNTSYDESDFGYISGGYRPAVTAIATGNMTAGSSQTGCFSLRIDTNGNIRGSCPATTEDTRVQAFGCWFTNDSWPSS